MKETLIALALAVFLYLIWQGTYPCYRGDTTFKMLTGLECLR